MIKTNIKDMLDYNKLKSIINELRKDNNNDIIIDIVNNKNELIDTFTLDMIHIDIMDTHDIIKEAYYYNDDELFLKLKSKGE